MGDAKQILVRPISSAEASELVRRVHYSGKTVSNSQLHLGVFWRGRLEGAMQFGPSMMKRNMAGLVSGTKFNGFLELNRMAFSAELPRNSESRALGIALRMIRKKRPDIEWIVSFADGTQCGDGTIYRAAGFVLTAIKENKQIWESPTGERVVRFTITKGTHLLASGGDTTMAAKIAAGWKPLPGFQLRYVYFLNPSARARLTVPVVPFSRIDEVGARMYKGERAVSIAGDAATHQVAEGGSTPTTALHSSITPVGDR